MKPGDQYLLDRDHEDVPSMLEDALGERLGTHGCVRNIAGERDPAPVDFGEDPSILTQDFLAEHGWNSLADKTAKQSKNAIDMASHLTRGLGSVANFDASGRVAPPYVKPSGGSASGGSSAGSRESGVSVQTALAAGGGAVLGALLLGPVGLVLGGGIGYLLGR